MTKTRTLTQYMNKVTDPRNWRTDFRNQVLSFLRNVAELYEIDLALSTVIGNGVRLGKLDPELRERFKVIVAGGLGTDGRPLAPILWGLFKIRVYPHKGNVAINGSVDNLLDYLRVCGIEDVVVGKDGTLFSFSSRLYDVIESLAEFLRLTGKLPSRSKEPVKRLIEDVTTVSNRRTRMDPEDAAKILKKYIPLPGQRADNLEKVLIGIAEGFRDLAPGVNPYVTFALTVDSVIGQDLLDLVSGDAGRFTDMVKILDYVALEDRRNAGKIIYNMYPDSPSADIAEAAKNVLSSDPKALRYILLYMSVSERQYGRQSIYHHANWLLRFCCSAYDVGCLGIYTSRRLGFAYEFEELVFGTSTLASYICSYLLSEARRAVQKLLRVGNVPKALRASGNLQKILNNCMCGDVAPILDLSAAKFSMDAYLRYWRDVYALRNAGLLYSPAFFLYPLTYPAKIFATVKVNLALSTPCFCCKEEDPSECREVESAGRRILVIEDALTPDLYLPGELSREHSGGSDEE